jgi:hypothetical protein
MLTDIQKQVALVLLHVTQVIQDRYSVPPDQLRMFVHYLPSYYHFHVHVTHVKLSSMGAAVGKAHLLEDIIGEGNWSMLGSSIQCCSIVLMIFLK